MIHILAEDFIFAGKTLTIAEHTCQNNRAEYTAPKQKETEFMVPFPIGGGIYCGDGLV